MENIVHTPVAQEAVCAALEIRPSDIFFKVSTRWRLIFATYILDFSIILVTAISVYSLTVRPVDGDLVRYASTVSIVTLICRFCFAQGLYIQFNALLDGARAVKSIALRWTLVFTGLAALGALTHQEGFFSCLWFAGFYGGGIVTLTAGRSVVTSLIRDWIRLGHSMQNMAIVGSNDLTDELVSNLERNRFEVRIASIFADDNQGDTRHVKSTVKCKIRWVR